MVRVFEHDHINISQRGMVVAPCWSPCMVEMEEGLVVVLKGVVVVSSSLWAVDIIHGVDKVRERDCVHAHARREQVDVAMSPRKDVKVRQQHGNIWK